MHRPPTARAPCPHAQVWSLGKLNYMPSEVWMGGFLKQAQNNFFKFTPTELANIIWALAKLGEWTWRSPMSEAPICSTVCPCTRYLYIPRVCLPPCLVHGAWAWAAARRGAQQYGPPGQGQARQRPAQRQRGLRAWRLHMLSGGMLRERAPSLAGLGGGVS